MRRPQADKIRLLVTDQVSPPKLKKQLWMLKISSGPIVAPVSRNVIDIKFSVFSTAQICKMCILGKI